jgi:hypothetical protein
MAKMSANRPNDVKDLYPSERKAAQGIMQALRLKHLFRTQGSNTEKQAAVGNIDGVPVCDSELRMMQAFETEARQRFAEIGLVVGSVQWDADVADDPNDNSLYWIPRPIISARVDKIEEIDHNKMAHEIQHGLLDGKEGVINPNKPGILTDPKKKDIF